MKNLYTRHGDSNGISLEVVAGTQSGDPVTVGKINGVAATNIGEGGNAATHASVVTGPDDYLYEVAGAIAGSGTPVYLTARAGTTAPVLSTTGTGDPWGHTVAKANESGARAATSGVAIVRPAQV